MLQQCLLQLWTQINKNFTSYREKWKKMISISFTFHCLRLFQNLSSGRGGGSVLFRDPPPSRRKTNHFPPCSRQIGFHVPPPPGQILQYFQKFYNKNIFLWQERYSDIFTCTVQMLKQSGVGNGSNKAVELGGHTPSLQTHFRLNTPLPWTFYFKNTPHRMCC